MSSPTQRSLKELRRLGWCAAVTERWNSFAKLRQDLWGFVDVLAMKPGEGFMAIQATTTANQSKRIEKIKAEPRALTFLQSGGRLFVHGWSKKGARGKRKTWSLNETELFATDIEAEQLKQ
jgi:hypothetical protein